VTDLPTPFLRTRTSWWLAGFAVWTALALLSLLQSALAAASFDQPMNWTRNVTLRFADWYSCALFTPVFFWATRRWPIERGRLATRVPLHLAITLGCVVAKYVIYAPIFRYAIGQSTPTFTQILMRSIISETIAFGALAGVVHAMEYYKRYRDRERLALQLQARLSDAQLYALRMQLNPHFLFNTLNAATTLLHRDAHAADTMLTRLGELLRLTLRADPTHETTLRDELALLERYLDIMRVRFSDRVTVRTDIAPDVLDAFVPSFMLQPLVENAFEHGISRLQRPGEIAVTARREGDRLLLTVRDDGDGAGSEHEGNGVGLANTRHRLRELYGDDGVLVLLQRPGEGTVAEIRLPLHVDSRAAA
jgi:sensor histidine kinase YesM